MNEPADSSPPFTELSRSFFFMVPFWGERRRYFVDRLLPSLLAPNNLPLLRAFQGHRLLIATTPEDWAAIIDLPIMKRLREYATPTLIEIPHPTSDTVPGSTLAVLHQNVAQKLLVTAAFQAKAYGCLLCPDFIVSDGMVLSLLRHAQAGHHLVLCPVLRQSEEAAVSELKNRGHIPEGSNPSDTGAAISIPQRVLADIMVRHLHPDLATLEEGTLGQPPLAPFRYWRLPNNRGIILHTFCCSPLLMDYEAIKTHDIGCLERDLLEDVYVARNFDVKGEFHIVQDSDEFCVMSLTPAAVGLLLSTNSANWIALSKEGFIRDCAAAVSVSFHTVRMPLKRTLFLRSFRWHGVNLDSREIAEEARISSLTDRAVRHSRYTQLPGAMLRLYLKTPILASSIPYARLLIKALLGDRLIWSHIRRRISFTIIGPFRRVLFWFASGGKDLDRLDPLHLSFRRAAGRRVVANTMFAADPTTAVILGIGQSNIANEGDPGARYEPRGEVYNFNFFDGKCYAARDPLLGASINRSNVLTRVGGLLADRGSFSRVPARTDRAWWDLCARVAAQRQDVSKIGVDAQALKGATNPDHAYCLAAGRIGGLRAKSKSGRVDTPLYGDGRCDQSGRCGCPDLCRSKHHMPQ